MVTPSIEGLLRSWSAELSARCDRVRNLIGSAHWLSDGQHKEEIIRDHLRKYCGDSWRVASGFAVDHANSLISPELDIHISHGSSSPLLNDGGITIIGAASLAAFVEVKATLTSEVLADVMQHQEKVLRSIKHSSANVWCGAVFYSSKISTETFLSALKRLLRKPAFFRFIGPNRHFCYSVFGRSVSFIVDSNVTQSPTIKTFEAADLSVPLAICDLFDFLTSRPADTAGSDTMQDVAGSVSVPAPTLTSIPRS